MKNQIETKKPAPLQRISYIFLLVAIALIFIPTGVMKFTNNEQLIANFSKWDLLKFKEIIGFFEILGIALFLTPRTNLMGLLLLSCIMAGAFFTHFTNAEPYFFNVAIFLVLWINYLFVKPKNKTQNTN